MNFQIRTTYNKAFSWVRSNDISFIGYLNAEEILIPTVLDIEKIFTGCNTIAEFGIKIKELNGVFSIIINKQDFLIAASDSTRFFPLFYAFEENSFIISDDIYFVFTKTDSQSLDDTARIEFLSAAFTCSDHTLFKNISQVRPGELLLVENGILKREYFFRFAKTKDELAIEPFQILCKQAKEIIDRSFIILLHKLKGRKIALPLSGGYDSRLIALKLKEHGFTDVVCFTYGRKNKEVEISKQVAELLGFKWYFVEYTHELIKDFHCSELFNEYYRYAARGTSMFYLQEYPAIKYLIENKIISSDFAVLPGHSGDFIRGALLLKNFPEKCNKEDMPDILISQKFIHAKLADKERKILKLALSEHLKEINDRPALLPYSILEDWELKERTSKYIFNSSHAFTFFGMQTFFPIWDMELVEFFRKLPYSFRLNGKLYYEVLKTNYFAPNNLDIKNDIQPSLGDVLLQKVKSFIKPYLPLSFKERLLLKNDWTFYGPMTDFLLKDLSNNHIFPKKNGTSYLYRILNWYVFKLRDQHKILTKYNNH